MTRYYTYIKDCPKCESTQTWAAAPEHDVLNFGCDDCEWNDQLYPAKAGSHDKQQESQTGGEQ